MNNQDDKKIYENVLNEQKIKRPVIKNAIKAFLFGGLICFLGELIRTLFLKSFGFDEKTSNSLLLIVVIIVVSLLTGLGIYDKFGQNAGAGSIIPISGFANSLTSSALESKSEGFVLGVMTNMFKLAGAIIVAGIASSFVVGTVVYLFRLIYA